MNTIIASRAQAVRPDQPQNQGLSIIPILGPSHDRPEYRLLEGPAIDRVALLSARYSPASRPPWAPIRFPFPVNNVSPMASLVSRWSLDAENCELFGALPTAN